MTDDPMATLIDRVGAILRELAEPGWDRIADTVVGSIQATLRSETSLFATNPDESTIRGTIPVTDLVLRAVLARAMRMEQVGATPNAIDITAEDAELTRIRIELTARYGSELRDVAERVRLTAMAVVEDLLGGVSTMSATLNTVEVVITDVAEGGPVVPVMSDVFPPRSVCTTSSSGTVVSPSQGAPQLCRIDPSRGVVVLRRAAQTSRANAVCHQTTVGKTRRRPAAFGLSTKAFPRPGVAVTEFDYQLERPPPEIMLTPAEIAADDEDLAAGLRGLAVMVAGGRPVESVLADVAGLAAHAIPDVDGAGVTLVEPIGTTMGVQTWSVTAPFVREIDIIQYETLQEGPCITCMQTRRPVISGSLDVDDRWPRFGPRVARLGVASVLSLPLTIDDQVVGSINAYARRRDAFGEHAVRLGSAFAGPAAVSVYNTQILTAARGLAAQLQRALDTRGVIEQAMGIIRARSGSSAEQAFERLRTISQAENVKVATIAQRLVDDAVRRAAGRNRRS